MPTLAKVFFVALGTIVVLDLASELSSLMSANAKKAEAEAKRAEAEANKVRAS